MKRFDALLFDVDGTLAETEELHRRAFNEAFAYFGLPWNWDTALYGRLLRVAGGKERIRHFLRSLPGRPSIVSDSEIAELHRFKTSRYSSLIETGVCRFRPGVGDAIRQALDHKQRLSIVTTTSRANVDALMGANLGRSWERCFDVVVAGDEVPRKKPAPEAYLRALRQLDLPARACLAIEDSRNGLIAASEAGVPVLITRSLYFQDEDFEGAVQVVNNLTELEDFALALPVTS